MDLRTYCYGFLGIQGIQIVKWTVATMSTSEHQGQQRFGDADKCSGELNNIGNNNAEESQL